MIRIGIAWQIEVNMYASQFLDLCQRYPIVRNCYKGAIAFDEIPNELENNTFYLVNTSKRNENGQHWWILSKFSFEIECFDSLGFPTRSQKKLQGLKMSFVANLNPVMSIEDQLCGAMSFYFCCNRIFNPQYHFLDIMNEFFTKSFKINKQRVLQFLEP